MNKATVLVTGVGAVSALGVGAKHTFNQIIAGKSGIKRLKHLQHFDVHQLKPFSLGGIIPEGNGLYDFNVLDFMDRDHAHKMNKGDQFAFAAAMEAMEDSKFVIKTERDSSRTGIIMASTFSNVEETELTDEILKQSSLSEKLSELDKYSLPRIANLAPAHLAIKYGIKGITLPTNGACAAGLSAISVGKMLIQFGVCDVVLVGASETTLNPAVVGTFARSGALAKVQQDSDSLSLRPFSKSRAGTVLGEGSACLILESAEHAKARNAPIYCELSSAVSLNDAHYVLRPDKEGQVTTMKTCIEQSGLSPQDIDYVSLHATGTKAGDIVECEALNEVLTKRNEQLFVSGSKWATGHLCGASGALEAVLTVLCVANDLRIPVPIQDIDPVIDFNISTAESVHGKVNAALIHSVGLGGFDAAAVFKKY